MSRYHPRTATYRRRPSAPASTGAVRAPARRLHPPPNPLSPSTGADVGERVAVVWDDLAAHVALLVVQPPVPFGGLFRDYSGSPGTLNSTESLTLPWPSWGKPGVPGAKFLVDNALSPTVSRRLTESGHDSVHVRDLQIQAAPDRVLPDLAAKEGRVMVSARLLMVGSVMVGRLRACLR